MREKVRDRGRLEHILSKKTYICRQKKRYNYEYNSN